MSSRPGADPHVPQETGTRTSVRLSVAWGGMQASIIDQPFEDSRNLYDVLMQALTTRVSGELVVATAWASGGHPSWLALDETLQ
jgi:hypothetical protein